MGDENPIRTLGDYSKPSHKGYRITIELPVGNNVIPLRFDTIRSVQNGCSFHELRSEDPNQHLKDFIKLVDSLELDGANRERTCLQPKTEYFPSFSARSYPTEDPQCSTHVHGSINAITIHPKQQSDSHDDRIEENEEEEKDNWENIHVNPPTPLDPSV
ncbi:hypothetical protein Tco_0674802 [Tanacetum coccineum]